MNEEKQTILKFRRFVLNEILNNDKEAIFFKEAAKVALMGLEDSVSLHAICIETPITFIDDTLAKLNALIENLERIKKIRMENERLQKAL